MQADIPLVHEIKLPTTLELILDRILLVMNSKGTYDKSPKKLDRGLFQSSKNLVFKWPVESIGETGNKGNFF